MKPMRLARMLLVPALAAMCSLAPPANPAPAEIPTQAFFTEQDLAQLACDVPEGLGRYQELSMLGLPAGRVFGLASDADCEVELFNLIQKTDGKGLGLWAGLRASALGEARRRGLDSEEGEAAFGDSSELRVFSRNGDYRGFWYAIEARDTLYVLRVYSDRIVVTPQLEAMLSAKLALVSD